MQYVLLRERRKTVTLFVSPLGELTVRAPLRLAESEIEKVIARHSRWIEKRMAQFSASQISFGEGDVLRLFGEDYTIKRGRAKIVGKEIYLPDEARERSLKGLLKRLTLARMQTMTEMLATAHDFKYGYVRVSSARGRWGSCNREKTIAYTFRLSFLPLKLCEYVAVHELCHTRHMNHSVAFWNEVGKVLPDWKQRRKELKELGYLMSVLPF